MNSSINEKASTGSVNQANKNVFGLPVQDGAMKTKEDFALYLASLGYRVFPCAPNSKIPTITQWHIKATTDPDQIREWWSGNCVVITKNGKKLKLSSDCNIGICPGLDYVILDVDIKNNSLGAESLQKLINDGLPRTFAVQTPSGGIHLYYKNNDKKPIKSVTNWLPGIDIRGNTGQGVGPGSVINGKPYTIYEFNEGINASC